MTLAIRCSLARIYIRGNPSLPVDTSDHTSDIKKPIHPHHLPTTTIQPTNQNNTTVTTDYFDFDNYDDQRSPMATTSRISTDCFSSHQCFSGIVPDECKAAGVACATNAMKSQQSSLSPPSSVQSPDNHISPAYPQTPASTGSQAIITSSDSEDSQSGKPPSHAPYPYAEERPAPRPTRPHRRIPHTIIERRYRDNLNTQIETLRLSLPSLKNAYVCSPDVEDSALPPRLPSKAIIIATAATYIKELEAERAAAVESATSLQQQVDDLQKLISCNDCSILQYLQAVGNGGPQQAVGVA